MVLVFDGLKRSTVLRKRLLNIFHQEKNVFLFFYFIFPRNCLRAIYENTDVSKELLAKFKFMQLNMLCGFTSSALQYLTTLLALYLLNQGLVGAAINLKAMDDSRQLMSSVWLGSREPFITRSCFVPSRRLMLFESGL